MSLFSMNTFPVTSFKTALRLEVRDLSILSTNVSMVFVGRILSLLLLIAMVSKTTK